MEEQAHERRRSSRLQGHQEAIILTPHGPHFIRDISTKGLCFECDNNDFFPSQLPVAIVYAGTSIYMQGVSVRLVREKLEEANSFITMASKKIGVEFLEMDAACQQQLSELISYHTRPDNRK